VVLWICPFVGGMIRSHTCGIVDMSICRWNDKITHMWISPCVGGMIKSHTYKWTYPQYHACEFIIPPTNGLIHMCVSLSFHLQMDISTIPHVLFYHSTYKLTYPQKSHTCGIVDMPICRWNESHKCG
jgi:hypothetical protein